MSVIIPSANADRWLDEAIASVLANEWDNVEVIVVLNGADPDSVPQHADDPRVRILRFPERLGLAGAPIKGLEVARGDFILRLDADDRMLPSRIQSQIDVLRAQDDVVLVSSRVAWIDPEGSPAGGFDYPVGPDVRAALTRVNVVPHSSIALRRSDLDAVGGYDASLILFEDYDFVLRLAMRGRVATLDKVLTEYRIHPSQVSRTFPPRGAHISLVLDRRTALARQLGLPRASIVWHNAVWRGQQWAMYLWRRLGAFGRS